MRSTAELRSNVALNLKQALRHYPNVPENGALTRRAGSPALGGHTTPAPTKDESSKSFKAAQVTKVIDWGDSRLHIEVLNGLGE